MSEFDDIMGSPREPSEAGRVGKGEKALTDGEAPLAGIRYLQGLFDALPGEEREQRWLRERLATLSVRESVALSAAVLRTQPPTAMDAINCLQSLDHYDVRINAGSYEALGHSWLRNETKMPKSALPFVDLEQTGRYYEDKHPGLFVGDCYVEYPSEEIQPVYYGQGSPLPEDNDWSVKLKIASDAVPEGVWLRLPGWEPCGDESSVDEELALRELKARSWNDCSLLDARCVLPQAGNLISGCPTSPPLSTSATP